MKKKKLFKPVDFSDDKEKIINELSEINQTIKEEPKPERKIPPNQLVSFIEVEFEKIFSGESEHVPYAFYRDKTVPALEFFKKIKDQDWGVACRIETFLTLVKQDFGYRVYNVFKNVIDSTKWGK